ncbi:sulfatase-like hydrolase/transferase [Schleiferilactobacillus harbinensis]|uniref:sulfatase-like hydrolase/transferase n=1 Tax=Schleiferilactobacillus harbinensis TaxID=304207 RepID=UPI00123BD083|nr:sulfatase-like hydrolase/transferase [Schleiferilactobacillus harbinensis]QEU47089.1 sulfatase-like hydrolase/transferase [Schleiferilactobacillus harbinensis]
MRKRLYQFCYGLIAVGGGLVIYLGVLLLSRAYAYYAWEPGQKAVIWFGLHAGNAVVQLMIPVLFVLAGFVSARKRGSLAWPLQIWLRTVSALILGTAAVFIGLKQLTLPAMLSSFLPLTRGVSAVFTGFIISLIVQPLFYRLLERFGQWPGWLLTAATLVGGSILTPAQADYASFRMLPLMVGLFLFGLVLQRSRFNQLRSGMVALLGTAALLVTWASQAGLGKLSLYYEGDYRFMDQLAGPFSLPVVLTAAALVVLITRWFNEKQSQNLITMLVISFTVAQSPFIGQTLMAPAMQATGNNLVNFGLLSIGLALMLSLAAWAWTIFSGWLFRRSLAVLDTRLAFTATGDYRTGLPALGRAIIAWLRRNWPPIMLVAVFYLTVFASFLAMSPNGKISMGLKGETQPILSYLLVDGQKSIVYTSLFLIAAFFVLYVLTTRFWVSFLLTETIYAVWTVANAIKMVYRSAPITPADLHELTALPELMAMLGKHTVWWVLLGLAVLITVIVVLERKLPRKIRVNWGVRIGGVILGFVLLLSPATANSPTSYSRLFNSAMGNGQDVITPLKGVQRSGPLLQFVNAVDIQVMDKPKGYSESRIQAILAKYARRAKAINQTRTTKIGDQTVIFNLSESFTDPKQFPDVKVGGADPMPYIRQLTSETTGGHMLSAGYGGGTANMEYEALTGLVMGNFSANVTPFSQVIPRDTKVASFNQNFPYSAAIHPYNGTFYNRPQVYNKMGIDKYSYLGSKYPITNQSKIQKSPYLSDNTAYANALNQINAKQSGQFIELVTMQNHMPYDSYYYPNNPYQGKVTGAALKEQSIADAFATFTYSISQTDQAVAKFIKALDQIKKPVTVVFYGDHFPGIVNNKYLTLRPVRMHATTFFIYSNKASKAHNTKLKNTNYVGTNDFIPLVLEHLNAQVSPYEALLTDVDHDLPIMSMPPHQKKNKAGKVKTSPAWVGDDGDWYNVKKMTAKQKQLYADYRMIQYDITAGRQYALQDKAFMTNPGKK